MIEFAYTVVCVLLILGVAALLGLALAMILDFLSGD